MSRARMRCNVVTRVRQRPVHAVHAKAHPAVLIDGSGRTVMVSVAHGGRGMH